ncbi:hypothetical protein ACPZ19_15655 [Amycolatopsis lurida]
MAEVAPQAPTGLECRAPVKAVESVLPLVMRVGRVFPFEHRLELPARRLRQPGGEVRVAQPDADPRQQQRVGDPLGQPVAAALVPATSRYSRCAA